MTLGHIGVNTYLWKDSVLYKHLLSLSERVYSGSAEGAVSLQAPSLWALLNVFRFRSLLSSCALTDAALCPWRGAGRSSGARNLLRASPPPPRPLSLWGGLGGAVHLAQELPGGRVTIKEAPGWESGVRAWVRPSDWVVWPCVNHSLYRIYCLHGEVEMLVNNWLSDVTELLGEPNKKRKYKAEYYMIQISL